MVSRESLHLNDLQSIISTFKIDSFPVIGTFIDPEVKSVRVYNYHNKTVNSAIDIIGAMGYESVDQLSPDKIMRRVQTNEVKTLLDHFPMVEPECLLQNSAPTRLQKVWDQT